jgi:GrpB-like predicted nucleotidyltransferase (UPF0157 family)
MKAKLIIDLDIIIANEDNSVLKRIIVALEKLAYEYVGDLGITGREAFRRTNATVPNVNPEKEWFKHNLYVCTKGSIDLQNHLNLRNYLIKNPQKVIEYSQLKENLAQQFPYDIDAYIDSKTDFIVSILNEIGMTAEHVELIEKQDKIGEFLI